MNEPNIEAIINNLSKEEQKIFEKIQDKIIESINTMKDSKFDNLDNIDPASSFSDKNPDLIHPKHITNSPHEILITVTAEVSEVDDKGYLGATKDLMNQHYHIPVKTGEDYSLFLQKFLEQFQQTLESTCRDSVITK
jgi:hypothetical protein